MNILRKYLLTSVYHAPEGISGGEIQTSADGQVVPVDPTTTVIELPADADKGMSVTRAARTLAKHRSSKREEKNQSQGTQDAASQDAGEPREPAQESTAAVNGAGDVGESQGTPPGEIESVDAATATDESKLPPIEPPRSWTKEDKELFAALPRETQERVAERERVRDTETSRRLQEATERAKGLEAERAKVEQVRQQFESALRETETALQQSHRQFLQQTAGEFADLLVANAQGGIDWDIAKIQQLAGEDILRFNRWQTQKMLIDEQANQLRQISAVRQAEATARFNEEQTKFAQYVEEQNKLFLEKLPEMADKTKAGEFQKAAMATLTGVGFEEKELAAAWQGRSYIPFHDARVQLVIRKASQWDEAQSKAKTKVAQAKPVPPVQRPGPAPQKGAAQEATIQDLSKKLDNATGMRALRLAAQLKHAQRAAR